MLAFRCPPHGGVSALTRDEPSSSPKPGAFGPFLVEHQIGMGFSGPVFRAYDPENELLVAVKAFQLDITPEQAHTLAEQLNRIAQIGLSEPGIVTPLRAGVEDSVAYLVLDYLAMESLDVAMRHYAPAATDRTTTLIAQLAGAIDCARAVGALHGALHLRDVFVAQDSAQVSGFGVVPALEEIGLRGPVRRPYAAPERVRGGDWGPTADIFSLAVIAYELLTGARPLGTGRDAITKLRSCGLTKNAVALEKLFLTAMADNPDERPRTAHEFASELEGITSTTKTVGRTDAMSATLTAVSTEEVREGETEPVSELVVESTTEFEEDEAAGEVWNSNSQEPAEWVGSEEDIVVPDLPLAGERSPGNSRSEPLVTEPVTPVEILDASEDSKPPKKVVRSEPKDIVNNQVCKPPTPSEVERILSTPEANEADAEPPVVEHALSRSSFEPTIPASSPQNRSLFDTAQTHGKQPTEADLESTESASSQSAEANSAREANRRLLRWPVALFFIVGIIVSFLAGYALRSVDLVRPVAETVAQLETVVTEEPTEPQPINSAVAASSAVESGALSNAETLETSVDTPVPNTELTDAPIPLAETPPSVLSEQGFPSPAQTSPTSASIDQRVVSLESSTIEFETRPPGAEVYVDGRNLGATPLSSLDISPGSHTIRFISEGYREWTTVVEVVSGQSIRVAASLEGAR